MSIESSWKVLGKCLPLLVCLAVAGLPSVSHADEDIASLRALDRNGDGKISVDEARAAVTAQFHALDKNKDGVLSESEYMDDRLSKLSQFDTNNDGEITRDEIRLALKSRFSSMRR